MPPIKTVVLRDYLRDQLMGASFNGPSFNVENYTSISYFVKWTGADLPNGVLAIQTSPTGADDEWSTLSGTVTIQNVADSVTFEASDFGASFVRLTYTRVLGGGGDAMQAIMTAKRG